MENLRRESSKSGKKDKCGKIKKISTIFKLLPPLYTKFVSS